VRYGQISVVPAEITVETHKHAGVARPHVHIRPVA
jgi:hypothetical protein